MEEEGEDGKLQEQQVSPASKEFDVSNAVTEILRQEREYLKLRETMDESYITYRTQQVMSELEELAGQEREAAVERQQFRSQKHLRIVPFKAKPGYAWIMNKIDQ